MKETYKVKTPDNIIIGDPWYFDMEKSEVERLTVNISPPSHFQTRVIIEEKPFEEAPEMLDRSMTIICAPESLLPIFSNGYKLKVNEEVSKQIGVDTAEYLINVDGSQIDIQTGADGCWGYHCEYYRPFFGTKKLDATVTNIGFSEEFEEMDDIRGYLKELFSDVELIADIELGEDIRPSQEQKM